MVQPGPYADYPLTTHGALAAPPHYTSLAPVAHGAVGHGALGGYEAVGYGGVGYGEVGYGGVDYEGVGYQANAHTYAQHFHPGPTASYAQHFHPRLAGNSQAVVHGVHAHDYLSVPVEKGLAQLQFASRFPATAQRVTVGRSGAVDRGAAAQLLTTRAGWHTRV